MCFLIFCPMSIYLYKAFVDRVVDGDTIDVTIDLGFDVHTKQRLRLFEIDAPETRTKDLDEKKLGLASKNFLANLIESKEIIVETSKTGKYGRYLATIHLKETDITVNQMMINEGHAKEYHGGSRTKT